MQKLDDVDRKILDILIDNTRTPFTDIAKRLLISAGTVHVRVKKMEDSLEYGFDTQNNGENTCKSPMGMFEESFIQNDLQFVKDCIIKYEN